MWAVLHPLTRPHALVLAWLVPYSEGCVPPSLVQLVFVPATNSSVFVTSHMPLPSDLYGFLLGHRVLIPSSHLGHSANNNSVRAGGYCLV